MKNLYEVLEVSRTASPEVIEAAYKRLCRKHHPDQKPESERKAATDKITEINAAYEVLKDKDKRKEYDDTGMLPGGLDWTELLDKIDGRLGQGIEVAKQGRVFFQKLRGLVGPGK